MMDRKELEIMAPAGNFECLHAAIQGGADSVYFGVGKLNMRSHSAANFQPEDLAEVVRICREAGVRSYLTLNITLYEEELDAMRSALDAAKAAGVDAVIASDMAAIEYCRKVGLEVHISTQLSISNSESLRFYSQFADVVVLARELNLDQVRKISDTIGRDHICGPSGRPVRIEMFAHGALCMAVSGKCYLSLHSYGASANRGSCYQVCRRGYEVTDLETGNQLLVDNKYIMSPKDLCTIEFMDKIIASGVKVFKIEGRARSAEYVKRCASCYRKAADAVCDGTYSPEFAAGLKKELAEVFNRGFWDGYYQGAYLGQWSEVYGSLRLAGHAHEDLLRKDHQLVRPHRGGGDFGGVGPCPQGRQAHGHRSHHRRGGIRRLRPSREPRGRRSRGERRALLGRRRPFNLPRRQAPPRRQSLHLERKAAIALTEVQELSPAGAS